VSDAVPSLSTELRGLEPLRPAERIVLRACLGGQIAKVSYRRPAAATADVTVRAEFLARLARGGVGFRLVSRRIEILGAWITGRLNLVDASVPMSLWMYRCVFDTTPLLDGARIVGSVGLPDCQLPGLRAESCTIAGDLSIGPGCEIAGDVRLSRTEIGRNLVCDRLTLRGPGPTPGSELAPAPARLRRPLVADGLRTGGDVVFGHGLVVDGELRLVGARVGGDLRFGRTCIGASPGDGGVRGTALNLDRIRIGGSARLDAGLVVAGTVRLQGARIEGDLDVSGALFDKVGDASWGDAAVLLLERARIGGQLALRGLRSPLRGASLADARVGALLDDASTWGDRLVLDGFFYARLAPGAPTDAEFRADWLRRQVGAHLGRDFRHGPWRHAIRVLRHQGRELSARRLAIHREEHLRRIGQVGAGRPAWSRALALAVHRVYGAVAGYGHRPQRLVALTVALWLACGVAYLGAAEQGAMAPVGHACAPECVPGAVTATAFRPFVYSLDQMVPGVDLHEASAWTPVTTGRWAGLARLLAWLEPLLGAAALATLLASWSGLTDRDRRR